VPQLALRAYPDDRLEDRGGTRPRFVERGYPTKVIITIPITLYGFGNGDDAEEGDPEGCAMGWSMSLFLSPKGRTRRLQRRALSRLCSLCSSCSVSLTTRTGSSYSLCRRSVSSRSPGGERGRGLCYVSTFYTTLVKKSQQANGASEHLRTRLPRTRVNKGVEVLNPKPQLSVFPLPRSGLRSRCTPCGSRILWQLPFGDLCQRALSCLGILRSPARSV
jgi:hypothetical protein